MHRRGPKWARVGNKDVHSLYLPGWCRAEGGSRVAISESLNPVQLLWIAKEEPREDPLLPEFFICPIRKAPDAETKRRSFPFFSIGQLISSGAGAE